MSNNADQYGAKLVLVDGNGKRVASLAFLLCVTAKTMDENAEEIEEDASLYQQYTGTVQTIIASIRADLAAEITARQNAISTEASTRAAASVKMAKLRYVGAILKVMQTSSGSYTIMVTTTRKSPMQNAESL